MKTILWDGVWYKEGETIIYEGAEWLIDSISFDFKGCARIKKGNVTTTILSKDDIQEE